ncbi:MAG: HEPN domain-containing protein [Candidatus Brocadia sp.]|nr:HEPN domain-containing protein [Candidatus Brocadia sp.]
MTDKDTLFLYRLKQAEETLAEAKKMVEENFTSRSIINRAYYAMFYAVLALFLKTEVYIQTSKHSGIISVFDKEFIKKEKIDKRYSKILHNAFDDRQEGDYKELVEIPFEKAVEHVKLAREFIRTIKEFVK